MIFWVLTAVFTVLFVVSFIREKRLFRNAIYLMVAISSLFMAIASVATGAVNLAMLGIFYIIVPLCLIIVSFVFISEGVISLKREGFSISHSVSIIFGVGIWAAFGAVIAFVSVGNLPTVAYMALLLVVLIAGYIIFTFTAMFVYSQLYKILPKRKDCDFIIVHGAGLIDGNRVSPLLAARLDKGIEVFERSGKTAKIIVSGGQGGDELISEAEAMGNYLVEKGIPKESILLENKSTTTLENMEFSKKIMDGIKKNYRTIFVTNDYHVFRTGTYAKKVGLRADGVGCKTAFYYWPNAFIREYIAIIIKYKAVPIVLFVLWLLLAINSLLPFNI